MRVWRLLQVLVLGVMASCSESTSPPGPASDAAISSGDFPAIAGHLFYLRPVERREPDGPFELVRAADGAASVIPTPAGGDVYAMDVSSDGVEVVYHARIGESEEIWTTRLDDPAARPAQLLADTDLRCPRWLPDSDRVVLLGEDGRIELLDVSTSETSLVRSSNEAEASCPDAVDDHRIVFGAGSGDGRPELRSLDLRTGEEHVVGSVPDRCTINNPAVSADRETIAVDAICSERSDNGIWTIPAEGGRATLVVGENAVGASHSESVQYWQPAWTADDSEIVYHRSGNALASIHVVAADGTSDRRIVEAIACCAAVAPS